MNIITAAGLKMIRKEYEKHREDLDCHLGRIRNFEGPEIEPIYLSRRWLKTPTVFTVGDSIYQDSKKENKMEITPDFTGHIKKIGDYFLIQLGCEEVIAPDLKAAGKAITKLLTEAYKEKDNDD